MSAARIPAQPDADQGHAAGWPPERPVRRLSSVTGTSQRPVAQWQPPVEAAVLARMADLLKQVIPMEQIVDDIGDVLSNQDPRPAEFAGVAERLRADVARLITIAGSDRKARSDIQARLRVERARALSAQTLPELSPETLEADCRQAVGYLRRLANAADDLLEHLAEIGIVKRVA
ncbi:DUF6415 family natural product biosynthesis protein [Streptomyces niveus]|uniref:DUF6415 family natural product biosynthesis protein n=2 Tax=Streptomyces niveus TaxID=193462 RepID=UPI00369C8EA0